MVFKFSYIFSKSMSVYSYAKYLEQCSTKYFLPMKIQESGYQKHWKNSIQKAIQFNLVCSAINYIGQ